MAGIISAVVRAVALLWTLIITALIGNVIASNVNGSGSATRAINYTMFTAAWAWVAGLYGLIASFIAAAAIPMILLFFDILAVLFTLVAAILLAAKLGTPNCGNIQGYGRHWIAFGSNSNEKRCREIQASVVFLWFLWATFCVALFFSYKEWKGGFGGFRRSSKPSMAQVRV
jgi:hypothetical protein